MHPEILKENDCLKAASVHAPELRQNCAAEEQALGD
jgi:hypothetical protein